MPTAGPTTGILTITTSMSWGAIVPTSAGEETGIARMRPGDVVQLSFSDGVFAHAPVIVAAGSPPRPENILVAAHSEDTDYRPLSSYPAREVRFLHILGVYR